VNVGVTEAFGGSPSRGLEYVEQFATTAEALGFDSLWVPEHIVFFDTYQSRYPYNEEGRFALGDNPGVFDPFAVLTAAALSTSTLKVVTSVMLIGERNPLITAREVATVDHLSGGRFLFGIGVGWSKEEYEALGVPWVDRGRRCDEYIAAMKELWCQPRSTYHGDFVDFDGAISYPKPLQSPHPPVLVGGNTGPALRRAARLGDGWFGWNVAPDDLEETIRRLHGLLDAERRSGEGFIVQVGLPHDGAAGEVGDYANVCAAAGVDRLVLSAPFSRRTFAAQLEQYSSVLELG